ncbi:MAG: carbohydrate kinase family protein [Acidobacteriia bacterium]|nr:carbohydrate kinase family protein [Terriglobia bacterium]
MTGVLCCGNLVLDILVRPVDRFPWGTTTLVDAIEQHLGGNGASTSYTLGKLGTPVRLIGMVGQDAFGDVVLSKLAGAGVETAGIARSPAPTATTVVLVDSSGNRMFLHRLGASGEAFAKPVEFTPDVTRGMSRFHLASVFGLPKLRPHTADLLRRAREAGLETSVDTQWDTLGRWMQDLAPCLPYTDLLFMNEDEARMLTGASDPARAAGVMQGHGARTVVLKLSGRGCAVFGPGVAIECPAFDVPVVDTTGAGDCFAGAFLAARLRGRSDADAAKFANATGALVIQQLGAVEGVRSYEETEEWMRSARLVDGFQRGLHPREQEPAH